MLSEIKRAAIEAFEASKPTNIIVGEVQSVSPISIKIDQKLILDEDFLILTNTLKQKTYNH